MKDKDNDGMADETKKRDPGGDAPGGGMKDLDLPRWLAPVLYGAVTLLLFRKFVFSGSMLVGQDTLVLGLVARDFFAQALKSGTFPFWNPIILGGTPFLDSLAGGDSLYPTSILLLIMEPFRALGWKLVIHVFLGGLFTFGWIRSLGRSRPAALLAGLAYLLAPFMVTLVYPGHDGKLFVTALTPLLFWATERALAGGRLRAFAGMAATIALVIFSTHFQQAYFLFGAVGVYAFVRCILLWRQAGATGTGPERRVVPLRFGLFLAFSVLGAGVSAIQLLPAVSYVTEFSRRTATTNRADEAQGVAYSSSWSLHPEEVASLVVPEFVGSDAGGADWTTRTYWGRNAIKFNHEYGGLVVLLLALVSFFGAPARGIRFTLVGIGGVALLFALGTHTPVWRIFYEVVPGISLFRAPSIATFLFGFSAITLMAYGVDRILGLGAPGESPSPQGDDESGGWAGEKGMLVALLAATGLLVLGTALAATGTLSPLWTALFSRGAGGIGQGIPSAVAPFILRGFLISTFLAGSLLALVWGGRKGKVPALLWMVCVGALVGMDEWRVDDPFIQTMDYRQWATPDANLQYVRRQMQDGGEPFRLLSFGGRVAGGQDVKPGLYGIELAAGHHPNDLQRYRDLIGMAGSGWPENLVNRETGQIDTGILSILNVRYVLWPVYQFGNFPLGEAVSATSRDGQTAFEAVYEIPTLPRARLVGEAKVLPEDEVVPYILSEEFRPADEVVLTAEPPIELAGGPVEGEVEILDRGINHHGFRVRSDGAALLALAENWYPAWKARVDGEEAPVLRANHTLRAVPVPPGEHEVEVYFAAGWFALPLLITLVSTALLAGMLFLDRRRGAA